MSRVPSPPPPAEMSSGPVAESWCYTQVSPRCAEMLQGNHPIRTCGKIWIQNKFRFQIFRGRQTSFAEATAECCSLPLLDHGGVGGAAVVQPPLPAVSKLCCPVPAIYS